MNLTKREAAQLQRDLAEANQLQRDSQRSTRPRPRPEREILHAILAYLRTRRDVVAWRQNSGVLKQGGRFVQFHGMPGCADIIGWRRESRTDGVHIVLITFARFLAIEVKAEGQEPTREQASFLELVRSHGGVAFVARSVDDVRRELGEL